MKNNTLKILLLILTLTIISCKQEFEAVLETDYIIVEVDYGLDNYTKNIRKKSEPIIIKERNIVIINVDKNGQIKIEGNVVEDSLIVTELKKYIISNPENKQMPFTTEKEFEYSGNVVMNKNLLISAKFNQELDYKKYSEIRNKIYSSFNEVRNEFSIKTFNKTLVELIHSSEQIDNLKWNELKQIFPIRYSEIIGEN
tara:strand:- start:55 stop:648 length:594 start_codon:yes stop_codon:yes gene_type:complete